MRVLCGVVTTLTISVLVASCSDTGSDGGNEAITSDASSTVSTAPSPSVSTAALTTTTTADNCDRTPIRPSPLTEMNGAPEVQGVSRDATTYGLLFLTHPGDVQVGELKIVWRMTGKGDLSVSYFAPDGRPGELIFGPEAHGGSNYDRPGPEWGTGFLFDVAGCWHIHLQRTVGSGDVWLEVVSA